MRFHRSLFLAILIAVYSSIAFAQTLAASVDSFDDAAAQKITSAVNAAREKAGLPQLEVNPHLNDSSKLHALEVVKHDTVSDQYPGEMDLTQRIAVTELGVAAAAENVAINPDLDAAAERFAENEVTRTNMLNPKYTDVGAAVLKHDGRYYVVANMVEALSKIGIDELENTVIKAIQTERKDHKIAPLNVVKAERLRTIACEMAKRGKLTTTQLDPTTLGVGAGFSAKNVSTRVVSFTVITPRDLPGEVTKLTGEPTVTNFSVGACKSDNEYYVTTIYYFDVRQYLR